MPGDPYVVTCMMGCAYGSSNEILSEWDPGPTYVVQRLWDPGEPSYTSRSCFLVDPEKTRSAKMLPRLYPRKTYPIHP